MPDYDNLLQIWSRSDEYRRLKQLAGGGEGPCSVFGLPEGPASHLIAALCRDCKSPAVIVTQDEFDAQRMCEELSTFLPGAVYLPAREIQLSAFTASSRELCAKRVAAMTELRQGTAKTCVLSVEALMQRMAPPEVFVCAEIELAVGQTIDRSALIEALFSAGYERVDKVDSGGQFRLSGGILDVYPQSCEWPLRIEFFDEDIDSIRTFDPSTQRSIDKLERAIVPPATEAPLTPQAVYAALAELKRQSKKASGAHKSRIEALVYDLESSGHTEGAEQLLPLFYRERTTVLNYMSKDCIIVLVEPNRLSERAHDVMTHFSESLAQRLEQGDAFRQQGELLLTPSELWETLSSTKTVLLQAISRAFVPIRPRATFRFDVRAASQYSSAIESLAQDIKQLKKKGNAVLLYAGGRSERLKEYLLQFEIESAITKKLDRPPIDREVLIVAQVLHKGYECPELKIAVLSESDIYGNRKSKVRPARKKSASKLDIFADLKVGDYVVHESYGVGLFKGIEKLTLDSKSRDFLVIHYSGTDKLFVPTDQLDRVQKFIGAQDHAPKLSHLGGADWAKAVKRVRESVKELAFDLVALYAERQSHLGFAFGPDTPWQRQLEDNFPFEETPDQLKSIAEVKKDMESLLVMDRLLCGDVGYGKTEVAVRAAFKAVQDSKQAAFLVPTTILAQQHYQTLQRRFDGFPVTVEILSRFRSPKQQKETLKRLEEGRVDIVVGTHRLLGRDVKYKDLGLLVVDEEQRFGVGHKELIKSLKKTVDVLTLSATPIPRTLHMAMVGIRDMSVIETPPEERYPVQTYVLEYSEALVREAILKEFNRGGQVYVLYNNVANMEKYLSDLCNLVPEVRIAMAHGQMPEAALERTMFAFLEREVDVLLCSTIIESGLDISNVNTIVIYDADKLGLSQLYQLRGRVGRSNRLAYAYLTFRRDKVLSEVAEKRLTAIREFTEFGSGFKIAMRDLEIRGAGNLLGSQQHGHMDEVGYDFYCKMVEEAVATAKGVALHVEVETQVDIPLDAHIPHAFIRDEAQRLEIYKRIASIESKEEYYDVEEEIEDRFGDIPQSVCNLMRIALTKAYARKAFIIQLTVRAGEAKARFHPAAPVDGAKFFKLLETYKGTFCIAPNNPMLLLCKVKSATVDEIVRTFDEFVQKLFNCINIGDSI